MSVTTSTPAFRQTTYDVSECGMPNHNCREMRRYNHHFGNVKNIFEDNLGDFASSVVAPAMKGEKDPLIELLRTQGKISAVAAAINAPRRLDYKLPNDKNEPLGVAQDNSLSQGHLMPNERLQKMLGISYRKAMADSLELTGDPHAHLQNPKIPAQEIIGMIKEFREAEIPDFETEEDALKCALSTPALGFNFDPFRKETYLPERHRALYYQRKNNTVHNAIADVLQSKGQASSILEELDIDEIAGLHMKTIYGSFPELQRNMCMFRFSLDQLSLAIDFGGPLAQPANYTKWCSEMDPKYNNDSILQISHGVANAVISLLPPKVLKDNLPDDIAYNLPDNTRATSLAASPEKTSMSINASPTKHKSPASNLKDGASKNTTPKERRRDDREPSCSDYISASEHASDEEYTKKSKRVSPADTLVAEDQFTTPEKPAGIIFGTPRVKATPTLHDDDSWQQRVAMGLNATEQSLNRMGEHIERALSLSRCGAEPTPKDQKTQEVEPSSGSLMQAICQIPRVAKAFEVLSGAAASFSSPEPTPRNNNNAKTPPFRFGLSPGGRFRPKAKAFVTRTPEVRERQTPFSERIGSVSFSTPGGRGGRIAEARAERANHIANIYDSHPNTYRNYNNTDRRIVGIALKWALVGKMRASHVPLWSWRFASWMAVERVWAVWELLVGRFLLETPWLNAVYRLLGADVALSARLDSFFRCWDLVSVGSGAVVSGHLYPRVFDAHGVRFGHIVLGPRCKVKAAAVLQGPLRAAHGVQVESAAVAPPHSVLEPAHSVWHGNICRLREKQPAAFLEATLTTDGRLDSAQNSETPNHAAESEILVAPSTAPDDDLPRPSIDNITIDVGDAPAPGCEPQSGKTEPGVNEGVKDDSEPFWMTRAAFPLLYLTATFSAVTLATSIFPIVSPLSEAWTREAWLLGVSYVATYTATGVMLLVLVVVLKISRVSPFLTDTFAATTIATFLPFIERSPLLVTAWHRLLGMRVGSDALILYSWTCPPSSAHLCSIGSNAVIFSSVLAPRAPATLWSYLAGRSGSPWHEGPDIVVEEQVGLYAQGRVEQGVRVGGRAQLAAFGKIEAEEKVKAGEVMAGNPPFRLDAAHGGASPKVAGGRGGRAVKSIARLLLLLAHRAHVTMVVCLAVQIEKLLPSADDFGSTKSALYGSILVRIVTISSWLVFGCLFEVLAYKWLILGRARQEKVDLGGWRALLMLHGTMLWDQALPLSSSLFAGGFAMDCVLRAFGFKVTIGGALCAGVPLVPFQDAEIITIEPGAIVDDLAYVSAHDVTTAGIRMAPTRVCRNAVLHPHAALFGSSLGQDSALYPRAKSLREVATGQGEVWAGTPAFPANAQRIEHGRPPDLAE